MFIIELISELLDAGGIVMLPLGILSFTIWYMLFWRISMLSRHKFCRESELRQFGRALTNGQPLKESDSSKKLCGVQLKLFKCLEKLPGNRLKSDIQKSARDCIQLIRADHHLIRCLVASAPLLGLLGTVWGMIETFDVISVVGTSEPGMLAGGISKAMITTQAGLTVAVPAIFMEKRLSRWEAWISHQIEETSLVLIQCVEDHSNS